MTGWCDLHDLPRDQCAHCGASPGIGFAFLEVTTISTAVVRRSGRDVFPTAPLPAIARPSSGSGGGRSATPCVACGHPTRDGAYGCEACGDRLRKTLVDAPWWAEQIEITMTKQRGKRPGAGGRAAAGLPWHDQAANLGHALRNHLVTTVRLCAEEHVRHSSPYRGLPENTIEAMSTWLIWRVDGLMLNAGFEDVLATAVDLEDSASWLIDRRPDSVFLGPCKFRMVCGGMVYARPGQKVAKCRACGEEYDPAQQRADLTKQLDDRLCTAAEIAKLATYLGIDADRDVVRRRINRWHNNETIRATSWIPDERTGERTPRFRFGDVLPRLAATYQKKDGRS